MATPPTPQPESAGVIFRDRYDVVLIDLDGVITDTADLHAACWKQMSDDYLRKCAKQKREPFHPFEHCLGLPPVCRWKTSLSM